jgi:hypothetical protein
MNDQAISSWISKKAALLLFSFLISILTLSLTGCLGVEEKVESDTVPFSAGPSAPPSVNPPTEQPPQS